MSIKKLIISSLIAGLLCVSSALAAPLHSNGCKTQADMQLCWNTIGEAGDEYGPFPEVFLLPIAWERYGDTQILADYSRSIYRQLLPSGLTDNLIMEWTPVTSLEEAMTQARLQKWSMVIWIAPQTMRESSPASPGLVDWEVFALRSGRLLRTMRIRVESKPRRPSTRLETGGTMAALLTAAGVFSSNPIASTTTVVGSIATAPGHPPEAGQSLAMMTELAARQIPTLFQFPMEELNRVGKPPSQLSLKGVKGLIDRAISP